MSIRTLLVPILMAAGACAHAPRGEADAPLAARLNVTASGLDVGLSDEAYVAVFAVTPGQGVTLVYPETHERTLYTAGWTTLAHNPAGRGSYQPRLARFLAPGSSTVLVLVASREPIDVRRFAAGASLERALGTRVYRSYDADAIIGGITRLTVSGVDDADWAMDVNAVPVTRTAAGYALLDEGHYPAENPFVTVYCSAPGTHGVVMVHVEFARYACSPADPPAKSDSTVTTNSDGGMSASRAPITRRTFTSADDAAAARSVGRERTETVGRTRATGAESQADRRVRAPQESAAGSGAATRVHEAPARGGGADAGRERAAGGAGERGARHP
ncbi:MAG TPA: hypothetical protein VFT45_18920 [Longimicrobium sp.]|nr:hypothetical protein [Longimicrobium sp.]